MARSEAAPTVVDAGPIIHLDELGCLDLLEGLGELSIPQAVWEEVRLHRPQPRPAELEEAATVSIPASGQTLIDPVATTEPFLFYRTVSVP